MDQRHFVFISSLLHPGHDSGHAGWDLPTENRNRKTELYVHLIRIISNPLKPSLITILIIERSGSLNFEASEILGSRQRRRVIHYHQKLGIVYRTKCESSAIKKNGIILGNKSDLNYFMILVC